MLSLSGLRKRMEWNESTQVSMHVIGTFERSHTAPVGPERAHRSKLARKRQRKAVHREVQSGKLSVLDNAAGRFGGSPESGRVESSRTEPS